MHVANGECNAGQYTLKFSNRQTATVQIVC
jgi:hypothetical protein